MSRLYSGRSTPQKSPHKQNKVDVNQEFCNRVVSLLASLYETPSTQEINTFPEVEPSAPVQPTQKTPAFDSAITDLRLKRLQNQKTQQEENSTNSISSLIDEISELMKESDVNLSEVFEPEKAERQVPLYIRNLEKDEIFQRELLERHPHNVMDMKKIQKEYTKRLKQAELKGKEKAKKRVSRQAGHTN